MADPSPATAPSSGHSLLAASLADATRAAEAEAASMDGLESQADAPEDDLPFAGRLSAFGETTSERVRPLAGGRSLLSSLTRGAENGPASLGSSEALPGASRFGLPEVPTASDTAGDDPDGPPSHGGLFGSPGVGARSGSNPFEPPAGGPSIGGGIPASASSLLGGIGSPLGGGGLRIERDDSPSGSGLGGLGSGNDGEVNLRTSRVLPGAGGLLAAATSTGSLTPSDNSGDLGITLPRPSALAASLEGGFAGADLAPVDPITEADEGRREKAEAAAAALAGVAELAEAAEKAALAEQNTSPELTGAKNGTAIRQRPVIQPWRPEDDDILPFSAKRQTRAPRQPRPARRSSDSKAKFSLSFRRSKA